MFSPLSSFIYFPAITSISSSLHVSIELINLTIASYLIVSSIAPTLLGDIADMAGRRPVYLSILSIYVAVNVGLALQSSYAALLVLRMVQSFGASGVHSPLVVQGERADKTAKLRLQSHMALYQTLQRLQRGELTQARYF
jgi:MFS family permease